MWIFIILSNHWKFNTGSVTDYSSLKDQIKHLENIFQWLTNEAYKRMKNANVSLDDFYALISSMNVSLDHLAGKYIEECFEKANTLAKMWGKLNRFWDFLNCELFQHVVQVMFIETDDPLRSKLAEYESEREIFLSSTKLCDFVDHWPFLKAKPKTKSIDKFKRIVVKVCKKWKDCTLHDVKKSTIIFSEDFSLPREFMLLAGARKSSVSIILYVPLSVASSIEEQVKQGKNDHLAENGFLSITIDGVQVYPLKPQLLLLVSISTRMVLVHNIMASSPRPLPLFSLLGYRKGIGINCLCMR